jgi:catechol 2,3-dioxygenase-like lactoylglutathione lyase family enzyme
MMHGSTTVLTVKDIMESLAYYRDKLGFDVAFEYGKPTFYVGLCSGEVTLHLVAASQTPRLPGHGAVTIFVDDVDALHADLVKRGAKVARRPTI